jgi:predicted alpha/beta superfamily hydrolase
LGGRKTKRETETETDGENERESEREREREKERKKESEEQIQGLETLTGARTHTDNPPHLHTGHSSSCDAITDMPKWLECEEKRRIAAGGR